MASRRETMPRLPSGGPVCFRHVCLVSNFKYGLNYLPLYYTRSDQTKTPSVQREETLCYSSQVARYTFSRNFVNFINTTSRSPGRCHTAVTTFSRHPYRSTNQLACNKRRKNSSKKRMNSGRTVHHRRTGARATGEELNAGFKHKFRCPTSGYRGHQTLCALFSRFIPMSPFYFPLSCRVPRRAC